MAWRLCELLEPQLAASRAACEQLYDDLEMPLIEVLAELEFNGIRLDVPLLQRLGEEMAGSWQAIEKEIYELAGHQFNIGSLKQLRKVLFDELKLPVAAQDRHHRRGQHRSGDAGKAGGARAPGASCRARSSSTARSPSSRAPTSMPCRRWSTRRRAASTPRSTRRWRRRAG